MTALRPAKRPLRTTTALFGFRNFTIFAAAAAAAAPPPLTQSSRLGFCGLEPCFNL
ncbi:hypothetical protein Hanom_Chr06g00544781 [Helianthus anomalus]